jgi:hypothetical protein
LTQTAIFIARDSIRAADGRFQQATPDRGSRPRGWLPISGAVEAAPLTHRPKAVVLVACAGAVATVFAGWALAGREQPHAAVPVAPALPVAGDFEPTATRLEDCSDRACLEQAFGNLAYYSGPKHALGVLGERVGSLTNGCHRIAHVIGAAALARFDQNVGRTFAEGSAVCASGYYHGVLERSLVNVSSREASVLGGIARGLCREREVIALKELEYQCLHGLGHGLMITTGYDLPVALEVCDHLAGSWESSSCNGGVFMENISTSYGYRSPWLRDDDLVYPCDEVAEEDKVTCYQLVTSRVIDVIGLQWQRIAEICAGVERNWVSSCFESFGRDVAGQTHRDPEAIVRLCVVARPLGGEDECIRFAAFDLVANDPSGNRAAALCASTSEDLGRVCFESVGSMLARASATRVEGVAKCSLLSVAEAHRAACVSGVDGRAALVADR